MDETQLKELLDAANRLLQPHLQRSEPLRTVVRSLGQWLTEQADSAAGAAPVVHAPHEPEPAPPAPAPVVKASPPPPPKAPDAMVPLKLGGLSISVPVHGTPDEVERAVAAADTPAPAGDEPQPVAGPGINLVLIQERCRLKADACGIVMNRRAHAGDPLREKILNDHAKELIATAKELPDCFLWMLYTKYEPPPDIELQPIAQCYEALAFAVSLIAYLYEHDSLVSEADLTEAMQMLAQADSALRVALEPTWLAAADIDQDEVHLWLRFETQKRQIYVHRHMKLDDPADPAGAAELIEQIKELLNRVTDRVAHSKSMDKLLKQVRYHVRFINEGDEDERHVQRIADAVEELVNQGARLDDPRLVRAIGPAAERLAARVTAGSNLHQAVEAATRAAQPAAPRAAASPPAPRQWSATVEQARVLLAGRSVVVIGGEPRGDAADRIKEAFALTEVKWPKLTEHGSGLPMRAPIEQDDTALVVILVKLAGHLHVNEAVAYARDAGKACILLPAGYNPEQIAEGVMQQASRQLSAAT